MARGPVARDLGVGVGVGAFSAVFGVGGGILLVPYLVLRRGLPQKTAQATSLVMVSMAAAAGAATYAVHGWVAWLPAVVTLVGGLAGVWIGAAVVQRITDRRLQAAFGLLLVAAGVRLLWPTGDFTAAELPELTAWVALAYLACGLGMGIMSALFGIGGGILLIPILVAGFHYAQQLASGTSLVVMAPIALLGAIRLTRPGFTQWAPGVRLGSGAIVGALAGATVALALSGATLRIGFALLVATVGVHVTWTALRSKPLPEADFPPSPGP